MAISAYLAELRLRLEAAGMVIVEEPDHLTIRLPFFCSVHVHATSERLRFESFFGVFPRVRSTTLKLGGFALLAVVSARFGVEWAGAAGFIAIVAGLYDSIRWQITEHAITRVTTVATMTAANLPWATSLTLGAASDRSLRSGSNPGVTPADRAFSRERRDD